MSGIQGTFGGALSPTGAILTRNLIWNTSTLARENATGGSTPGANVKVTNFPASQNAVLTSPLDTVTGGVTQIDTAHHEVHEGEMFSFCEATDLGNGAVRDVLLVTPDTAKEMHLVYEATAEAELDLKFYEGPTASNNGTGVTAVNRKRSGTPASPTMAVYHTPTIAGGAEGTLLCQKHFGSGKSNGGEDRGMNEWILKRNTKYLIRKTNATTSNNYTALEVHWYEEG